VKLLKKVEAGEVESIIVSGENLEIILKNGTEATSRKEAETGLTETLKNYGVSAGALQEVNISFKDESGFKHWAGILIPTLLPLLIIVLVFWWIFRRARGGMNQAFTFGKANLKISIPSKTKITFKDVADLKEAKEELEEVVDFLKKSPEIPEDWSQNSKRYSYDGPPRYRQNSSCPGHRR